MRIIPRHHPEIYLPLFAWAEAHQRIPTHRLCGYCLDACLNVTPIWSEVNHD